RELRRPPKMNAQIGTPFGFSHSGSITGHWLAGVVYRAFGCAALRPQSGVQCCPVQSISSAGAFFVIPSHHTSPSGVKPTLVKIVFFSIATMADRFDRSEVPGATPKKPDSGLIPCR